MNLIDIMFWSLYFVLLFITIFLMYTLLEGREERGRRLSRRIPSVSVIVPAYNEEKSVRGTIESLLSLDYPGNRLEIIAVNDGSADRTLEVMKSFRGRIKVIDQPNRGKGAALNAGLRASKGELVACLDADSFVSRDTLKGMVKYFSGMNVAAVTPIMKVRKPGNFLQSIQWLEYLLYIYVKKLLEKINCIHVTPGPFTIYRKSVLDKLGGFDENSIVEDQEIAYRLQKHNYTIRQSENGEVTTIAPSSLMGLYRQRSRWFRGSFITLMQYRNMVFNRKYGDFGMYHLPSLAFGMGLFFFVILFFLDYAVFPVFNSLRQWSMVNFQVNISMDRFIAQFGDNLVNYLFYTDFGKVFILAFVFSLTMVLVARAHGFTREKIGLIDVVPLAFFFLVYYVVLSFFWAGSMAEFLVQRAKGK